MQPADIGDITYPEAPRERYAIESDPTLEGIHYQPADLIKRFQFDPCTPLTALGRRLLKASNALWECSKFRHAPDGTPAAEPGTTRHANHKPRCADKP